MTRRRRLLIPLLASLLSACGTTVPVTLGAPTTAGDGLQLPAAAELGTVDSSAPIDGAASTGAQRPVAGAGQRGPEAGFEGTTGVGTAGPAGTAPPLQQAGGAVRVGLLYFDGAEAVASNLGISGLTTGDAKAQAEAVVRHLNATGGLAGRRIELREGRMDAARAASDAEGTYAAACTSLVEDQKVSYVVSYVNLTSSRLACYAQRGVTVLDDQSAVVDRTGRQYSATFAGPGELAPGRAAEELVEALWRRGWLTASSKVGTLVPDTPDGVEIETQHLIPALKRRGLEPAASARAAGTSGANQNGTVLQFRSAGVDRVVPMGQSPLFLMNAAESQGYRPAYAMNSGFGPGALLETAAPRAQLENAAGIGWSKHLDIGAGTKPGPVSGNETLCFTLMRDAGQQSSNSTTQAFQASLCNVLMFLKAAADRHGVSPRLLDAVRTQGLDFAPADTYAVEMRPGRADGAAAYRDLAFDPTCDCFQYVSGNRRTR